MLTRFFVFALLVLFAVDAVLMQRAPAATPSCECNSSASWGVAHGTSSTFPGMSLVTRPGTAVRPILSIQPVRNRISASAISTRAGNYAAPGRPDLVWMRGAVPYGIGSCAHSPDGTLVATGPVGGGFINDYSLKLWRVSDQMLLRTWPNMGGLVSFSADGRRLGTFSGRLNRFFVLSVEDGSVLWERSFSPDTNEMRLSPDGRLVVSVGPDRRVHWWNIDADRQLPDLLGHPGPIGAVVFSPDGALFATVPQFPPGDRVIRVWRAVDGTLVRTIEGSSDTGHYFVAFRPGTNQLVVATQNSPVRLTVFNLNNGQVAAQGSFTRLGDLAAFAVTPDGSRAFACDGRGISGLGNRQSYVFLNLNTGAEVGPVLDIGKTGEHWLAAASVSFSPDGTLLTAAGNDNSNGILRSYRMSGVGSLPDYTPPPSGGSTAAALAVSPDGTQIVSLSGMGSRAGLVARRTSDGLATHAHYVGYQAATPRASYSPNGQFLVANHEADPTNGKNIPAVFLYRVSDWKPLWHIEASINGSNGNGGKLPASFSADSQFVAIGVGGGVEIRRTLTGGLVRLIPHSRPFTNNVAFSPTANILVVQTADAILELFNPQTGASLTEINVGSLVIRDLQYSADGSKLVISGEPNNSSGGPSGTGEIQILDGASLGLLHTFSATSPFRTATLSPDGLITAAGTASGSLILYDLISNQILTTYSQETSASTDPYPKGVWSLRFSPDGKYFYYGRDDGTVASALSPAEFRIYPDHGGNTGDVTVKIVVPDNVPLSGGAEVELTVPGQPPIFGRGTKLVGGHVFTTTFDLRDAALGVRELVIKPTGGSAPSLSKAFTVEQGTESLVITEILGRSRIRSGTPAAFALRTENRSNIDILFVRQWAKIPAGIHASFTEDPSNERKEGEESIIYGDLVGIPALGSVTRGLRITSINNGQFQLTSWSSFGYPATPLGSRLSAEDDYQSLVDKIRTWTPLAAYTLPAIVGDLYGIACAAPELFLCGMLDYVAIQRQQANVERINAFSSGDQEKFEIAEARYNAISEAYFKIQSVIGCQNCPGAQSLRIASSVESCSRISVTVTSSLDPNELVGPSGAGNARWVPERQELPYFIAFENLSTATAPAAEVTVTSKLDSTVLDLLSITLGTLSVGDHTITPTPDRGTPLGTRRFRTDVDLRPQKNILVHIDTSLDILTGNLTWRFTSLDPSTGLPPDDPLAGFLDPGKGGSMFFTVLPKPGVPTGTQIHNRASIVFDANAPLDTNEWMNTMDSTPPQSRVALLPAVVPTVKFPLAWSGADVGSGLRDFTIYASDNGGPYVPLISGTSDTVGDFTGLPGHTYAFYSVARDKVFTTEAVPAQPDAVTKVDANATPPPPAAPTDLTAALATDTALNLTWTDNSNNETGFRLERKVGTAAFTLLTSPGAGVTTYRDGNLTPHTTYTYRVRAYNAGGESANSNEVALTTPYPLGGILEVTPLKVNFKKVKVKKTKLAMVTLRNASTTERLRITVTPPAKPFGLPTPLGTVELEPGATRPVPVSFTPPKKKNYTKALRLRSGAPVRGAVNVKLRGVGK